MLGTLGVKSIVSVDFRIKLKYNIEMQSNVCIAFLLNSECGEKYNDFHREMYFERTVFQYNYVYKIISDILVCLKYFKLLINLFATFRKTGRRPNWAIKILKL